LWGLSAAVTFCEHWITTIANTLIQAQRSRRGPIHHASAATAFAETNETYETAWAAMVISRDGTTDDQTPSAKKRLQVVAIAMILPENLLPASWGCELLSSNLGAHLLRRQLGPQTPPCRDFCGHWSAKQRRTQPLTGQGRFPIVRRNAELPEPSRR